MSDVTTIVDAYFAMWNETDPSARAELIARAWADDAHYVDPMLEADGPAALSQMVEGVHAQFPGHTFRRLSGIDTHHDRVRFGWDLVAPDGAVIVAGIDVGELSPDGRLRAITGFFGEPPAQEAA
ncbi:MAG TPA: nuclear transport factor 2 family protein [Acidimicrobiales bacterium]|nr:nuclear transport factor 2 family protein [Acidimicrobiales bacterium]